MFYLAVKDRVVNHKLMPQLKVAMKGKPSPVASVLWFWPQNFGWSYFTELVRDVSIVHLHVREVKGT